MTTNDIMGNIDKVIKSSEEIGSMRTKHAILSFLRDLIIKFEKEVQEKNWQLVDINMSKEEIMKYYEEAQLKLVLTKSIYKTIEETL